MKNLNQISPDKLLWPAGWKRTKRPKRSQFYTKNTGDYGNRNKTVAEAVNFLLGELRRLGVSTGRDVIVTNNMRTKNDGMPYSNAREPEDSGVAVYFIHDGQERCFPCDTYDRVADNIYAIAKVIEALRTIDRHSTQMMQASFQGFSALPAQGQSTGEAWWTVLGVNYDANYSQIVKAYRAKAKKSHPDSPSGSNEKFIKLREAFKQAKEAAKNNKPTL